MPLYRGFNKSASTPPTFEPTRRIARPEQKAKARPKTPQATLPVMAPPTAAPRDPLAAPVVGWLAVISGPGRGTVLPLHYGINDMGRDAKARIRLDFGDPAIASDNQAAIIYTAGSRRFYLQSVAGVTWLNGRLASASEEIKGGDVLQAGKTRLRFIPLCGLDFDWRDGD